MMEGLEKANARIGILTLDRRYKLLLGNVAHSDTHPYPVIIKAIAGLRNPPSPPIVDASGTLNANAKLFVDAARALEAEGAAAIIGSCGFFSLLQKVTVAQVSIPVATSPLLLIPLLRSMFGLKAKIGVLTLYREYLTPEYFHAVGVFELEGLVFSDMSSATEFRRVIEVDSPSANVVRWEQEIIQAAVDLKKCYPSICAFLLECSDMTPFTARIQRETELPVFDYLNLIQLVRRGVAHTRGMC